MAVEDAVLAASLVKTNSLDSVDKFYESRSQGIFYLSSNKSIVMGDGVVTDDITISGDGNGKAYSVTSSDETIASAYIHDGNVITIAGHGTAGTATITVKDNGSISYKPSEQTIAVSATESSETDLTKIAYSDLQTIISNGFASKYFKVGDRLPVKLNGTVGAYTFSNYTTYAYILGLDHNSAIEGKNRVHFQFAFNSSTNGVHTAFCDSNYNNSGTGAMFHMNSSNVNTGGWSNSYMRKTICGQFLSALPTDLQSVISACTKYTDNTGGGSDTASYVTSTSDKIFLPSEYEIQGARSYANSAEKNYQKQYDYYKNGNSKVMYNHNSTSSTVWWWLRSPYSGDSTRFCLVTTDGGASDYSASDSNGFAPCFTIA